MNDFEFVAKTSDIFYVVRHASARQSLIISTNVSFENFSNFV